MRSNARGSLIDEMEGKECEYCGWIVTAEDVADIKEDQVNFPVEAYEHNDAGYPIPRCSECYQAWFHEQEFHEDHNPMHPEETREEFAEHEDLEPED